MMVRAILFSFTALLMVPATSAPQLAQTARERAEVLHLIRKEKLDLILPGAMRDNNVDMWIHVVREGDPDPMRAHFGPISGYAIFTDRGGDRIERALFGGGGHPDLFDLFGAEYSSRIVSAENVITDFRVRRVQREIVAFSNALEMHRQILERALSNEVIEPGVTTLGEIGWWVREQFAARGLDFDNEMGVSIPRILYSAVSDPTQPRQQRRQPGDRRNSFDGPG